MPNARRYFILTLALFCAFYLVPLKGFAAPPEHASDLTEQRHTLDQTVWSKEVEAQRYEQRIVRLWDELRNAAKAKSDPLKILADFPLKSIGFGKPTTPDSLELGIRRIRFTAADSSKETDYDAAGWKELVRSLGAKGFDLVESEWHHSSFEENSKLIGSA